jgi:hypothetical protein
MGILDSLESLAGGGASSSEEDAFDRAASSVPHATMAESLAHAFNSDQTPPFEQMLGGLFGNSDPDQKAGLLNQILGSLPPGTVTQILGSMGAGGLAGAMSGGYVTPGQAQEISPEAVQDFARAAAKKDPSIVDMAAGFYAQHPTLVKALGTGALALIVSKVSSRRA